MENFNKIQKELQIFGVNYYSIDAKFAYLTHFFVQNYLRYYNFKILLLNEKRRTHLVGLKENKKYKGRNQAFIG